MDRKRGKIWLSVAITAAVFTIEMPQVLAQQRGLGPLPQGTLATLERAGLEAIGDPNLTLKKGKFPRGWLGAPSTVPYGIEMERAEQYEMRREMFFLMSRFFAEPGLRRAALTMRRGASLRAVVDAETDDKIRRRATYLEIEQWKGTSPRVVSPGTQAAWLTTGVVLATGGMAAAALPLGKDVYVRPHPWPAGVFVNGYFSMP